MEQSSKGRTHYQVLGVSPCATLDQIKAAHRALALKYHPDKNNSTFESQFLAIQKAWECLRDETSRQDYDDELTRQNQPKHIHTIPLNDLEAEECDLEEENEDDGTITTITIIDATLDAMHGCMCATMHTQIHSHANAHTHAHTHTTRQTDKQTD